jgi:hypothetical protein
MRLCHPVLRRPPLNNHELTSYHVVALHHEGCKQCPLLGSTLLGLAVIWQVSKNILVLLLILLVHMQRRLLRQWGWWWCTAFAAR